MSMRFQKIAAALAAVCCAGSMTVLPASAAAVMRCTDVTITNYNTIATLGENGYLYIWGTGAGSSQPVRVTQPYSIRDICGSYFLTTDDRLFYYTYASGQFSSVFVLGDVKQLFHGAAVTKTGGLYLMGEYYYNGDGTDAYMHDPAKATKVPGISGVKAGYSDSAASMALTEDGKLYTWGSNAAGQYIYNGHLGYISSNPAYDTYSQLELKPRQVPVTGIADAKFANGGDLYFIKDKTLYRTRYATNAVNYEALCTGVSNVEAGLSFHGGISALAWSENGVLHACGNSIWGFGDGKNQNTEFAGTISRFGRVRQAETNGAVFAVVTTDGSLYTWGDNSNAMIGNGKRTYSMELGEVGSADVLNAYQVTAGDYPANAQFSAGDANMDGKVDASDAAQVLIAAARQGTGSQSGLTPTQQYYADINSDDATNASDAALILQYSAKAGTGYTGTVEDFLKGK